MNSDGKTTLASAPLVDSELRHVLYSLRSAQSAQEKSSRMQIQASAMPADLGGIFVNS